MMIFARDLALRHPEAVTQAETQADASLWIHACRDDGYIPVG